MRTTLGLLHCHRMGDGKRRCRLSLYAVSVGIERFASAMVGHAKPKPRWSERLCESSGSNLESPIEEIGRLVSKIGGDYADQMIKIWISRMISYSFLLKVLGIAKGGCPVKGKKRLKSKERNHHPVEK